MEKTIKIKADESSKYYIYKKDYDDSKTLTRENMLRATCPTFEKVPFEQFLKDWKNLYGDDKSDFEDVDENVVKDIYDKIQIPKRSTKGSAGYDFTFPVGFTLPCAHSIVIPTGIRCRMPVNCVLLIVPRSGLGFKYRISVMNTVGVIDSDYYNAKNYGHIMIKIVYDGDDFNTLLETEYDHGLMLKCNNREKQTDTQLSFEPDKGFAQGIFTEYMITSNELLSEETLDERTGGFGSTDNK
jgi:dUTP pyrophosphatase